MTKGRRVGLVAAVVLGVAGVALIILSASDGGGRPRLVGGNLPIDETATNPRQIAANNSPSVTRDPTRPDRLALANRVDSPALSCALHVSNDGGSRWSALAIPFPEGEEQPPRCFAPDVAFGADGRLYVSFVTLKGAGNTPNALWLAVSADSGRTLDLPRRVWGPLAFGSRVVADPDRAGRVSLVWLQVGATETLGLATTANPVLFARSDDGGSTWSGPFEVGGSKRRARSLAPSPALGPDGRAYVAYLDLGGDVLDYSGAHGGRAGDPYPGPWKLVLAMSDDGGMTWSEAEVDAAVVPADRIVSLFPPTPSLAVDPRNGRVYVAMSDGRAGDPDVLVWASPDGVGFGPPVRVNDTGPGDGGAQYLPAVAVSPSGRVDVVYYDRRRDPANLLTDASLQSSTDGGRSFGASVRLTERPFDSRIGFGAERGLPDLGSRLAVVSSRRRALAIWSDTRAGTVASGKQDLTRAVVAFGSERSTLRFIGFASTGTALVAAAVLLVARPKGAQPVNGDA